MQGRSCRGGRHWAHVRVLCARGGATRAGAAGGQLELGAAAGGRNLTAIWRAHAEIGDSVFGEVHTRTAPWVSLAHGAAPLGRDTCPRLSSINYIERYSMHAAARTEHPPDLPGSRPRASAACRLLPCRQRPGAGPGHWPLCVPGYLMLWMCGCEHQVSRHAAGGRSAHQLLLLFCRRC